MTPCRTAAGSPGRSAIGYPRRSGTCRPRTAGASRTVRYRRVLARRELPVGRADLSAGQPAAAREADPRPHQAAPARALGDQSRPKLYLCSPEDRPVIFAYHGYPWLIHRLTYKRTNHDNIHVRGYIEKGTTTTPFD